MAADEGSVLAVNAAFYAAFAAADEGAMEALWARRAAVACIHPGWGLLSGRAAVMESWRRIFRNAVPDIFVHGPKAFVLGETAFVVCLEIDRKSVV